MIPTGNHAHGLGRECTGRLPLGEMALFMFVAPLTWRMLAHVMHPTAPDPVLAGNLLGEKKPAQAIGTHAAWLSKYCKLLNAGSRHGRIVGLPRRMRQ